MALNAQAVIMFEPSERDALDELARKHQLSRSTVVRLAVKFGIGQVRAALDTQSAIAGADRETETADAGS